MLENCGFKAPPELKGKRAAAYKLALLGFHRDASSLLYNLEQNDPDLLHQTLVIDFNVALHEGIRQTGATVKYGDLANPETLHHLGLNECEVIVCTIPDDLLRGIDNAALVHVVREMAPKAVIISNAIATDDNPQCLPGRGGLRLPESLRGGLDAATCDQGRPGAENRPLPDQAAVTQSLQTGPKRNSKLN